MSKPAYVGIHPSRFKELLRHVADPKRRAQLNDRYQQGRAQLRRRRASPAGVVPHANWRLRARPRVTRLPAAYRGSSVKAVGRQRARQRQRQS